MKLKSLYLFVCSLLLGSCTNFFSAINYSPSPKVHEISFSDEAPNPAYRFFYSDTLNNTYLRTLRQDYALDQLVANAASELDSITIILGWSSAQWEHNGSNTPSKSDALTILEEAKNGSQFRCVEYGILAAESLNALAIPARPLSIKTRDVAKVRSGAGHVVTEVYSASFNKWIFIDPQFNVMPLKNGIPLNGVEFQQAIYNNEALTLVNNDGVVDDDSAKRYLKWIGKYLYFFDVTFDQRIGEDKKRQTFEGKTKLMLVPLKAENPTTFQRSSNINYCIYTHSLADFYREP